MASRSRFAPVLSGIHMILVVGYGCSNWPLSTNCDVSSSSCTMRTELLYSSWKLPTASRKRWSGRTDQFMP